MYSPKEVEEHLVFVVNVIKSQRSMTRRPGVRRKEMIGSVCKCSVSLQKIDAILCLYEKIALSGIRAQ
jgi:hypothetical protein